MYDLLKTYRQDLHRIPELGNEEYKTKEYIIKVLRQYNCEIIELVNTGVIAFFKRKEQANRKDRNETIAFRSDMDGLPVSEETGVEYCSTHHGHMHACGHDGHMAMLLAFAGKVNSIINEINHNVLLIFQPAEETTGGAKDICQTGILSKYNVKCIYGIHLWPMLKKHAIGSKENEFMAKSSEIDIFINGKSAHCANADAGIDALLIGCKLLIELYQIIDHEIPSNEYGLLKFGEMKSGTVRNIIASNAELHGTLRCLNENIFDYILNRMREIATYYENQYQCKITIQNTDGYPPVINDSSLFRKAKGILSDFDFYTFREPFMLAEDFSYYQQEIPGLFLFLGTGTDIPLHSSTFDFDEEVLETGLEVYLELLKID